MDIRCVGGWGDPPKEKYGKGDLKVPGFMQGDGRPRRKRVPVKKHRRGDRLKVTNFLLFLNIVVMILGIILK